MRPKALVLARWIVALALPVGGALQAQTPAPDTATSESRDPFFTRADAILAGSFVVGAFALAQGDARFAHTLQDPGLQESATIRNGASVFKFMGQPAPEIIGLSLYGVGRLMGNRSVAALGLHGLEALALTRGFTFAIKGVAGRARPYVHADTVPNDFEFLRGIKEGHDFASFPSGHTATAFSVAASSTAEVAHWVDRKGWWPGWTYVVGGTLFGGAALVGVSRMYHDQHWASDVIGGAAIGTFSGVKVVKYAYGHPTNRVDRWLLPALAQRADDGGMTVAWEVPVP